MKEDLSCQVETPFNFVQEETVRIEKPVFEAMWRLFNHIVEFWKLDIHLKSAKSQLLSFMQNRIKMDLNYYSDYKATTNVLIELSRKYGEKKGHIKLLTDPAANIAPPMTKMAQARQRVSNEFIILAISMGGFKTFGPLNALGHIGNANMKQKFPYRVYQDEEKN